jgi:hypothetical protein
MKRFGRGRFSSTYQALEADTPVSTSADFADRMAIYGLAYALPISQPRPILDKGQNQALQAAGILRSHPGSGLPSPMASRDAKLGVRVSRKGK